MLSSRDKAKIKSKNKEYKIKKLQSKLVKNHLLGGFFNELERDRVAP